MLISRGGQSVCSRRHQAEGGPPLSPSGLIGMSFTKFRVVKIGEDPPKLFSSLPYGQMAAGGQAAALRLSSHGRSKPKMGACQRTTWLSSPRSRSLPPCSHLPVRVGVYKLGEDPPQQHLEGT